MKELIKQYLDDGMSRRQLMTGLSALGMSAAAAKAMAQSLAPSGRRGRRRRARCARCRAPAARCSWRSSRRPGVKYVFFNPSTGDYPIFDALVDEPGIQVIKGIQEGAVVAMADGYARASGKPGVVIVANVGLPNAMTQMVNSYKDQIPLLVAVASVDQDTLGRDQLQEADHHDTMTQPITKWYWTAKTTAGIPETLRRGLKFASTPPCGPVFLSLPNNTLREEAKAAIWDQAQVRRADAHPARQGRHRKGGAHADRGEEPADQRRRRDHLVPRRARRSSSSPSCWACRSPASRARSASGRSRSRPGIRSISARSCATCASPASPTCCSTSATASASAPRPAPR